MKDTQKIKKLLKELENVADEMIYIGQGLEAIENSLFFANERSDKDMTKPCAAALELMLKLFYNAQERAEKAARTLTHLVEEG